MPIIIKIKIAIENINTALAIDTLHPCTYLLDISVCILKVMVLVAPSAMHTCDNCIFGTLEGTDY